MAYRVEAKSCDRKGNPKAKFQFYGKSKKAAMANARRYFRKARNCEAGVMDDSGVFHPIEVESPRAAHAAEESTNKRRNKRSRHRNQRHVVVNRRKKNARRRKNKMPPALARYWRKVRAKKNRRK